MILFLMLFYVFGKSLGDNGGGCQIKSITPEEWRIGKRWDPMLQNEDILHKLQFEGTLELVEQSCNFLILNITANLVTITGAPEIEYIDNMIPPSPKFEAICELTLACRDGRSTLTLVQPIIDVNDYEPVFHNSSYQILIPRVIPKDTDLMQYMKVPIQIEDGDFSNYNISFDIRPDDFKVKTKIIDLMYRRIYIPVIQTKETMQVTHATYLLTATDTGNIPYSLSKTTRVMLQRRYSPDDSYTIYFSRDSYVLVYAEKENRLNLLGDVDIQLFSDDSDVQVYFKSEDSPIKDYLEILYDDISQNVKIGILKSLSPLLGRRRKLIFFSICGKSTNFATEACTDINITAL